MTKKIDSKVAFNLDLFKQENELIFLNDINTLVEAMKYKKNRCIVFHIQTKENVYKKNHILEFAAVEIENFQITNKLIYIYNPKADNTENEVYNYNQDIKIQFENFLNFIGEESYLISNDVAYNYHILNNELKYYGLKEISKERFRCIFKISKKMNIRIPNKKLNAICNYLDIRGNYNECSFHNNLFDAIMISKIFIRLCLLYSNDDNIFLESKKEENEPKKLVNICRVNVYVNDVKKNFLINPEINSLDGTNGIYHLISENFGEIYSPESHLMKIKIGELWHDITNREICKFYFLNNLRDNVSIKLIKIK